VNTLVEVLQSVLFLSLVAWAGARFLRKRLSDRQARVARELAEAAAAEGDRARLLEEARATGARVAGEIAELVRTINQQAEQELQAAQAQVETEAQEVVAQARQSVDREKEHVRRDASARLLALTTEAARRYLDEMLSESERRAVTQKAILASLEQIGQGLAPVDSRAR
jgi:F0F1-type ATP synthase membrane subunit b/b'